jgi:hypothetical protein
LCGRPAWLPSPQGAHRPEESIRNLSQWVLLFFVTVTLAFLIWNLVASGASVREEPGFRTWSRGLCLALCLALAIRAVSQARDAWREGLRRQACPCTGSPGEIRERSVRVRGPARPLVRYCVGELEKQFPRFYAFQRYRTPYLVYFYYAKKGSFSLFGFPFVKTGFLLLFLIGYGALSRGDASAFHEWERVMMAIGCVLVVSGLVIRVTGSFQSAWIRIVEEPAGVCLTLSVIGLTRENGLARFWRSFDPYAGVVSRSTHSR